MQPMLCFGMRMWVGTIGDGDVCWVVLTRLERCMQMADRGSPEASKMVRMCSKAVVRMLADSSCSVGCVPAAWSSRAAVP